MLSEKITSLADVSFHIVAYMYARFRYSGKNRMRFAVFWRISVRFCGFRTPLTPPSQSYRKPVLRTSIIPKIAWMKHVKRNNFLCRFIDWLSCLGYRNTPAIYHVKYHGQFLCSVDISIDGYFQWQIYLRKVCSHTPGRNI